MVMLSVMGAASVILKIPSSVMLARSPRVGTSARRPQRGHCTNPPAMSSVRLNTWPHLQGNLIIEPRAPEPLYASDRRNGGIGLAVEKDGSRMEDGGDEDGA